MLQTNQSPCGKALKRHLGRKKMVIIHEKLCQSIVKGTLQCLQDNEAKYKALMISLIFCCI